MTMVTSNRWIWWFLVCLAAAGGLVGCDRLSSVAAEETPPAASPSEEETAEASTESLVGASGSRLDRDTYERRYPWRPPSDDGLVVAPLSAYVEVPGGFERVESEGRSFGVFLRDLPVRLDRKFVKVHDGRRLESPSAGVVSMPMSDDDLQQCADSVLRLYAEHLWQSERRDAIGFHFTSGDRSDWSDWREGERFRIDGAEVARYDGAPRGANREAFRGYLRHLFTYAGTQSLRMDARRVELGEPTEPGDFFLEPGSPGHVVLVLDVAEKDDGERVALIGQGFMPAQEFHLVEAGGAETIGGVWFRLPGEGESLHTPSWQPFGRDQRWRFEK